MIKPPGSARRRTGDRLALRGRTGHVFGGWAPDTLHGLLCRAARHVASGRSVVAMLRRIAGLLRPPAVVELRGAEVARVAVRQAYRRTEPIHFKSSHGAGHRRWTRRLHRSAVISSSIALRVVHVALTLLLIFELLLDISYHGLRVSAQCRRSRRGAGKHSVAADAGRARSRQCLESFGWSMQRRHRLECFL